VTEQVKIDIDTSGLDEMFRKLERYRDEVAGVPGFGNNPVRSAARKMAKIVEAEAKRLVPVEEGRTQARITSKIMGTRYRDKAIKGGNSREYYYVGVDTRGGRQNPLTPWWATPLHQGWDQGDARFAGAPFLEDAVKSKQGEAFNEFVEYMRKWSDRAAARIEKT